MTKLQLAILATLSLIILLVIVAFIGLGSNTNKSPQLLSPTPDLRPRISGCIPWQLLSSDDVDKTICVAGIVQQSTRVSYGISGKAFSVTFFEENDTIRFYVLVHMMALSGTPSPNPGNWGSFREQYPSINNYKNCIGVSGTVVDYLEGKAFYDYNPSYETYFMEINYPESVKELDGCVQ